MRRWPRSAADRTRIARAEKHQAEASAARDAAAAEAAAARDGLREEQQQQGGGVEVARQ